MSKNKKTTTCVLLFLSAVIWGTIGWKVYEAIQEDTPAMPQTAKAIVKEKKNAVMLLLNYRDPFLDAYSKAKPVSEEESELYYIEPEEEIMPDFQYKGIIKLGEELQAIISRNGESLMLKTRDKIGEFSILQIGDDKLIVSRKGEKYELPLR
jgi:hypothetical protein